MYLVGISIITVVVIYDITQIIKRTEVFKGKTILGLVPRMALLSLLAIILVVK